MRNLGATVIVSVLLGGIAYAAIFFWQKKRIDDHHAHMTSFEWFCEEFQVGAGEREKIEALHEAYFPECKDHCVHYADTSHTLAEINEDPQLNNSAEHEDAAKRLKELAKEADKQYIDFIYGIAAELDPDQSERYLQRMKGWLKLSGEGAD